MVRLRLFSSVLPPSVAVFRAGGGVGLVEEVAAKLFREGGKTRVAGPFLKSSESERERRLRG